MKKKTSYITFCALISALISALMAASYFPYLTYAVPAVAGALIILPLVEISKAGAVATYFVSSLLVLLFAEPEAKLMYVCFFGYYPILKSVFEGIKSRVAEYILKLLTFNVAVTLVYFVFAKIFGIPLDSVDDFGKYTALILYTVGNIAFILYDICLARLCGLYIIRLHEKIKRIMRF